MGIDRSGWVVLLVRDDELILLGLTKIFVFCLSNFCIEIKFVVVSPVEDTMTSVQNLLPDPKTL